MGNSALLFIFVPEIEEIHTPESSWTKVTGLNLHILKA